MNAISPSTMFRCRLSRVLAIFLLASLSSLAPGAEAEVVNRIVLRVNNEIATLYDYERRLQERLQAIRDADLPEDSRQQFTQEAGQSVLRDMLDEMLLLSRAEQLNMKPDEIQIDEAMRGARERAGLRTEEEFRMALAQSGMTYDTLRERMEKNITLQMIMGREVQSRIQPTEEEGLRYYRDHKEEFRVPDQVSFREVIVLDQGGLLGANTDLANGLYEEVLGGKALEDATSAHEALGLTTGVIRPGLVSVEDLDSALAEAVAELEPGDYSPPVAARGGLHIVQLLERKESHHRPFQDVANDILAQIQEERFDSTLEEYMGELEGAAYIRAEPPAGAEGFRVARGKQLTVEELLALGSETLPDSEEAPAEADGSDG